MIFVSSLFISRYITAPAPADPSTSPLPPCLISRTLQYSTVREADYFPTSWPRSAVTVSSKSAKSSAEAFQAASSDDFWSALSGYLATQYSAAEAEKIALECRRQYAAMLTHASKDTLAMLVDEAKVVAAAASAKTELLD